MSDREHTHDAAEHYIDSKNIKDDRSSKTNNQAKSSEAAKFEEISEILADADTVDRTSTDRSLSRQRSSETMIITADGVALGSPVSPQQPDLDDFFVELVRSKTPLGFKVADATRGGAYVRVTAIIPESTVDLDGRIEEGDYIKSINGISLQGCKAKVLSDEIASTSVGQHMEFKVARPVYSKSAPCARIQFESTTIHAMGAEFGRGLVEKIKDAEFDLAEPSNASTAIVNSVRNKVVVVSRGGARFVDMARRVEDAGGRAAVVINAAGSSQQRMVLPPDDDGSPVGIPIFLVSYEDGTKLKKAIKKRDKFRASIDVDEKCDRKAPVSLNVNTQKGGIHATNSIDRGATRLKESSSRGRSPFTRFFTRKSDRILPAAGVATGKLVDSENPHAIAADPLQGDQRERCSQQEQRKANSTVEPCSQQEQRKANSTVVTDKKEIKLSVPVEMPEMPGLLLHDSIVPCEVESLYRIMFHDRKWIDRICELRHLSALSIGDWVATDTELRREIRYMIPLNLRVGPNQADAYESQVEAAHNVNNRRIYELSATVITPDVPYGRSFEGKTYYVLAFQSDNATHLRCVTGEIVFQKNLWSMTKSMIARTGHSGMQDYWKDAAKALFEVIEDMSNNEAAHVRVSSRLSKQIGFAITENEISSNLSNSSKRRRSVSRRSSVFSTRLQGTKSASDIGSSFGYPFTPLLRTPDYDADMDTETLATVTERTEVTGRMDIPLAPMSFLSMEVIGGILVLLLLLDNRLLVVVVLYLLYRVWQLEQRVHQLAEWHVQKVQ